MGKKRVGATHPHVMEWNPHCVCECGMFSFYWEGCCEIDSALCYGCSYIGLCHIAQPLLLLYLHSIHAAALDTQLGCREGKHHLSWQPQLQSVDGRWGGKWIHGRLFSFKASTGASSVLYKPHHNMEKHGMNSDISTLSFLAHCSWKH